MRQGNGKKLILVGGVVITLGVAAITGVYLPFYANVEKVQVEHSKVQKKGMWANINDQARKNS